MKSPEFYMQAALNAAKPYLGAGSPNPSVGAAAFDKADNLIYSAAHTKCGEAHAEAKVIEFCRQRNCLDAIHTLAITLEPCNHHGLTPPCTTAILNTTIQNIIVGLNDPNPKAAGGIDVLRTNGRNVITNILPYSAWHQMAGFMVRQITGRPLTIIKIALNENGDMIPPHGQTTFTDKNSLILAHRLRKHCDGILTGSGTILADNPQFTVRHVPDFLNKKRHLTIMDRRRQINDDIIKNYTERGFTVNRGEDIQTALNDLAQKNCNTVLIEAGPQISASIMRESLWDIAVFMKKNDAAPDTIFTGLNPEKPLLKQLNPFNIYDCLATEDDVRNIPTQNIDDAADTLRHISSLRF